MLYAVNGMSNRALTVRLALFLSQANEQLRAVLLTLLEELPSDVPILLLGVAQESPDGLDLIFPKRTVYVLL